ncbi:cysteine hydrolase family protein [Pelagibaculum spongiae]|uniref:Isochorismatase-like domain-containing protein n=1 Tax=Pelagibaculum spongiae TaxID=2080658 RepID=A0A2V1GVI7_9GAMM|nr:isochorismatase family protein [Pelagibaculum spongiae]PVZ63923.1 hypothetical protein DC094_20600 [Pelagibaculum spongiae]
MLLAGSLAGHLSAHLQKNANKVALLVIDESWRASSWFSRKGYFNPTRWQQEVLYYVHKADCHIWLINFVQGKPYSTDGPDQTRSELKAMLDMNSSKVHLLQKPHSNAFEETNLHEQLQSHGIERLVIMGWHSNSCIHATIGARDLSARDIPYNEALYDKQPLSWRSNEDGATHYGYKTMTSSYIIHGGDAYWKDDLADHFRNLEFYKQY